MTSRAFRLYTVFFHLESILAGFDEEPLKAAVGSAAHPGVLDVLRGMDDLNRRRRVLAELDRLEHAAAAAWKLPAAVKPLLSLLRAEGLRLGIFSRLGQHAVRRAMAPFLPEPLGSGLLLVSREQLLTIGRRRNPFRMAATLTRRRPETMLVVASDPSVLALARAAGAVTVGISPARAGRGPGAAADFEINAIGQLGGVIRMGLPLSTGKLPNALLRELLAEIVFEDPSVIINPGVGEDITAVDIGREEVLVLKSDPITFATDAAGQYAVLVNANDIATSGAVPRWLLTTMLFPPGTTPSFVRCRVVELSDFCRRWGITLCGGHTEITDAVTRPVISGAMAGTVRSRGLIDKRNMRPGDHVLLTKAAAVEGTAIIARELGARLRSLGMAAAEIQACRDFLELISILPEARLAAACPGTSAMHDVTEGGVATAIEELGAAGGRALEIDLARIPVFPETRRLCRLLRINPLGLIGSGSLLICCQARRADRLMGDFRRSGIPVARIGEVLEAGSGIRAVRRGRPARWKSFAVDEIARLFSQERAARGRNA